jgi:predicted TIM-barrel fold metal-dependent hydrolase
LEKDGVAGEVIFPNTIPPFAPKSLIAAAGVFTPPADEMDYALRLEGLRAHNRWLTDFCSELPGRRCGLPQVFLNDLDDTIEDLELAAENGHTGFLLPLVPPDAGIPGLFDPVYDRLWAACRDLDLTITQHSGAGTPNYGKTPSARLLFLKEAAYFSQRHLGHLILSGVFHRYPELRYVMTEQDASWVIKDLQDMDEYHMWMMLGVIPQLGSIEEHLPNKPSEYFQQNVWLGASFPTPTEAESMKTIGIDKILWGSDYPHREGTYPFTREHLRRSFHTWKEADLRKIFSENISNVYKIDLGPLAAIADRIGPTKEEIAIPLEEIPEGAMSVAFIRP